MATSSCCLGDEAGDGEVIHLVLDRVLEHIEPFRENLFGSGHEPLGLLIDQVSLRDVLVDGDFTCLDDIIFLQAQLLHVDTVIPIVEDLLAWELKLEVFRG